VFSAKRTYRLNPTRAADGERDVQLHWPETPRDDTGLLIHSIRKDDAAPKRAFIDISRRSCVATDFSAA
jgi:hypothetical protein